MVWVKTLITLTYSDTSFEQSYVRPRSASEDRHHRLSDWVCPNDRQLTLRAKYNFFSVQVSRYWHSIDEVDILRLRIGWSVRAELYEKYGCKPKPLTDMEQEIITTVIKRAEAMEKQEQERIG